MWRRLLIALFCAAVSFGFNSNGTGGAPAAPGAPVVNPPGGQNNYLPINQPTWTGAGAGPTLNLTGAAPALTFNGVPIGGSCAGSDFINAISASGVISCATPAGGGGGLPTPVSVANGGLGQGNAPTAGQILVAQSGTLYSNVTTSGNATISTTGVISVTSYTGPNLNLTGALTFNGTAVGGTCATGSYVTALSTALVPTCSPLTSGNGIIINNGVISLAAPVSVANGGMGSVTVTPAAGMIPIALNATNYVARLITGDLSLTSQGVATVVSVGGVAGPFAPQTNPAGGQNNYAPINNPTFSGTITFPNGSIADAALVGAYSGVGACTAGQFVTTLTRNAAPTCATPPGAGTFAPLTNPAGGQNNYLPINVPTYTGLMTGPQLLLTSSSATQILLGPTTTTPIAALSAAAGPSFRFTAGTYNNGTNWVATAATAQIVSMSGGSFFFTSDSGLTTGNPYTPTNIASLSPTAFNLTGPNYQLNGVNFGGACTGGQFVSAISSGVIPTCATPATGNFAPLTNPANGQNNYAPLNNPTFTGVSTWNTPATLTFPDASTYTSGGHNNMLALGVGQGAGTDPIAVTRNVNGVARISLLNNNAGAAAYSAMVLQNASALTQLFMMGTGSTVGGGQAANTGGIFYNGTASLNLTSVNSAPIDFWVNNNELVSVTTAGLVSAAPIFANFGGSGTAGATGSINTAANTFTLVNGATIPIVGACSGIFSVVDTTSTGAAGLYMCGGAQCEFIGSSTGTFWGASSTTPAAGFASVAFNGTNYAIYNNRGNTVTFGVTTICARSG